MTRLIHSDLEKAIQQPAAVVPLQVPGVTVLETRPESSDHTDSTLQSISVEGKNGNLQPAINEKGGDRRRSADSGVTNMTRNAKKSRIIIRIEVQDTGVGLRPRDIADHKLFSPYVQTEIGKRQGGKGTGRKSLRLL